MAHISTPTPSHALATDRMDVRALWEVYAANPPEIRAMLPRSAQAAAREKTAVIRLPPTPDLLPARVRAAAPFVALLVLSALGGYVATSRAAQRGEAVPAPLVVTTAAIAPAPVAAPLAQNEPQVVMTIELADDTVAPPVAAAPPVVAAPPVTPGTPSPATRPVAPKKFRVANDADMTAAARANQASQQALDSSLK